MTVSRRFFVRSSGLALFGVCSGLVPVPRFLARAAESAKGRGKTLVVVFQRGAADGLNMVVPHAEKAYYAMRPNIAIPRPGRDGGVLDLADGFGLHPALEPFRRLWKSKQLAVIHAAGSPHSTRSHFDAQDFMETGTPGVKSTRDGWLNRYLQAFHSPDDSRFRAVAATSELPRILAGKAPSLAIPDLARFGFDQRAGSRVVRQGLEQLYASSDDPLLAPTARETFEAVDVLERIRPERYEPAEGVVYPNGQFGRSMLQIAQLIKAGVGLEIAFADIGGWDHHVNEGASTGRLANLLREFGGGIDAFVRDLGDRMEDVVLLTMSEFGRTARENGSGGTDHGHANVMFAIGGDVRGGRFHGEWPGLEREQLYEGRDLALTADFRDVVGSVLAGHLGVDRLGAIFPGFTASPDRFGKLIGA